MKIESWQLFLKRHADDPLAGKVKQCLQAFQVR